MACRQTVLLQPHGVLSHWVTALVVARVAAEGEPFGQPERAVLTLPFRHDNPQQYDEEDDDNGNGEQIEQLGALWARGFTWKCKRQRKYGQDASPSVLALY